MPLWYGWGGLKTGPVQSWMGGVLGSCVGSSEGFPEVWALESLPNLSGVGGCAGEEEVGWVSSGLRSGHWGPCPTCLVCVWGVLCRRGGGVGKLRPQFWTLGLPFPSSALPHRWASLYGSV